MPLQKKGRGKRESGSSGDRDKRTESSGSARGRRALVLRKYNDHATLLLNASLPPPPPSIPAAAAAAHDEARQIAATAPSTAYPDSTSLQNAPEYIGVEGGNGVVMSDLLVSPPPNLVKLHLRDQQVCADIYNICLSCAHPTTVARNRWHTLSPISVPRGTSVNTSLLGLHLVKIKKRKRLATALVMQVVAGTKTEMMMLD